MNLEIVIFALVFFIALLLIFKNFRAGVFVLLILSTFLHKELFSIYRWDALPVRVFMLALLGYTIIYFSRNLPKLKEAVKEPFVVLLFFMWLVNGISIIFTKNLYSSITLFGFFTAITALGFMLFAKFKGDVLSLEKLIKFYIGLAVVLCLFAVFQGFLYYQFDVVIGALWSIPNNLPRIGATFWDVNHFGAFLAVLMPLLGTFLLVTSSKKARVMYGFAFLLMGGMLLLTNSRTAWILALVAFLSFVTLLLYKKFKARGVMAIALVLSLILVGFYVEYSDKSSPFRAKVKNYFHYRIDSFDSHMLLLQGAYQVFEESPILGGGYGGFFEHFAKTPIAATYFGRDPAALNTRVPAHTIWGETLAETGAIGMAVFLLFVFLLLLVPLYLGLKATDKKQSLVGISIFSALLGWFIAGIFYSYKSEFFWLIVFLYFLYSASLLGSNYTLTNIIGFVTHSKRLAVGGLVVLAGLLVFIALGRNHLIPWDEAIYAQIARNMVDRGNFVIQTWKFGEVWYEKPPLVMWLMALSFKLLGVSSFAARLPSALFGVATVILTYIFGKKLFSRTAGFISAFALLTTFHFLYYARTAMLDIAATFFITLCLYLYWLARSMQKATYWKYAGLACGFAVLTKGVVGFLPVPIIVLMEAKNLRHLIKPLLLFILFAAIIFLPWHLDMYRRFGSAFLANYIGYHVVNRAVSAIEDKGRPIWWYLEVMKVSMRIWFVVLLGALPAAVIQAVKKLKPYVFLVAWLLFTLVFFSVAKSKLVWYILPAYPAAALIVGQFLAFLIGKIQLLLHKYSGVVVKFLLMYVLIVFGLIYLFVNKTLVYTSDLTGPQARLLMLKDKEFGVEEKVYVDRIELPLVLFYTRGPFEVVDYGPLKLKLDTASLDERVVFITKESRYQNFSGYIDRVELVDQQNEWVLAYLDSRTHYLKTKYDALESKVKKLELKISQLEEDAEPVPDYLLERLDVYKQELDEFYRLNPLDPIE